MKPPSVRPSATVLVVDERAAETCTAPGDHTERFFADMRNRARRAGYADTEILSIEHPSWRFYRLVP